MKRERKILFGLAAGLVVFAFALSAAPAAPSDQDVSNITRKVYPSVVKVEVRDGWRKVATGVVIDKQGHIVTTALITPRNEGVSVWTADGERFEAEYLGMDSVTHLAVIKAKGKTWKPIDWGRTKDVDAGSWIGVVSISPEETPAVTQGIVSSVGKESLRLNVWLVPGASGSPVVDAGGRMVGLIRGTYADELMLSFSTQVVAEGRVVFNREESPSSALAMAIPVHIVEKVALEIKEKGKVERGWLGVTIGENQEGRVLITRVESDSPAEDGGLEIEDIILEFDKVEVTGSEMLAYEIRMRRPGKDIEIVIEREGREQKLKVELGEYSEKSIIAEFQTKFPRLFEAPNVKEGVWTPSREPDVLRLMRGERKFIGVYLQELTPELAEFFGAEDGTGLLVTRLSEDGPAAKAGIRVGDVIVKADGRLVRNQAGLSSRLQRIDKGDAVELEIIRDKKKQTVSVNVEVEEGDSYRFFSNIGRDLKQKSEDGARYLRSLRENDWTEFKKKSNEFTQRLRHNLRRVEETTRRSLDNMIQRYRCMKV